MHVLLAKKKPHHEMGLGKVAAPGVDVLAARLRCIAGFVATDPGGLFTLRCYYMKV
jgi:hypothetical protein